MYSFNFTYFMYRILCFTPNSFLHDFFTYGGGFDYNTLYKVAAVYRPIPQEGHHERFRRVNTRTNRED